MKGGRGGLGNVHFKSATFSDTTFAQPEKKVLKVENIRIKSIGRCGFNRISM